MKPIIGGFEDIGEAAHEAGGAVASQVKKQAVNTAKATVSQITGGQSSPSDPQTGTNEQNSAKQSQQMSDDQAKQFLQDLYGPSKPQGQDKSSSANQANSQNAVQAAVSQVTGNAPQDPNAGKTPEEIAQMATLRKQLHADYYQSLTQPKQQEERAADKMDREEKEEKMADLEEEKKKPAPLPATVKQGTGESVVGVSG